jgi:hypothetical protein
MSGSDDEGTRRHRRFGPLTVLDRDASEVDKNTNFKVLVDLYII